MAPYIYVKTFVFSSYLTMIYFALLSSFAWVRFVFKKVSIGNVLFFIILSYVSAFSLSVIFFAIFNHDELVAGKFGLSFHGGFLGCVLATAYFCKEQKISFLKAVDKIIPVGALAVAIIRVGCFLAGCCRGTQTDFFLGVAFPNEMSPLIFRHPVQLYDSFLNMMLFFYLFDIHDRKKYDGHLFLLFLFWNSCIRFFVEYFRWGVSAQVMFGIITQAQLASLGIIAVSLFFMKKLSQKQNLTLETVP